MHELAQPEYTPVMTPTTDDDPYPSPPNPSNPPNQPPLCRVDFELIDPLGLLDQSGHSNINTWAIAVFSQLAASGSVRAKIVNDQEMAAAHTTFSGIDGTTDVLTFDLNDQDSSENKILDTDLLICIDEASRQAQQQGHSQAHELLLYIIHGTLHCLGYDDHSEEDFKAMHDKEDQLLTAAGIGPLFYRGAQQ